MKKPTKEWIANRLNIIERNLNTDSDYYRKRQENEPSDSLFDRCIENHEIPNMTPEAFEKYKKRVMLHE